MAGKFRSSSPVANGFTVRDVHADGAAVVITMRSTECGATCPGCGVQGRRVHSRYVRNLADLPISGRTVRLRVDARRFRCDEERCTRRIFAERTAALVPWSPLTVRSDALGHHLGLALGGRPGASLASRLVLPVSSDTLLRLARRRGTPAFPPPRAIGIDDRAWKRNHRHGTLSHHVTRVTSARTIARLMTAEPDALSRSQTITVAALEAGVAALVEAREVTAAFHRMVRQKREGALGEWLERARTPFANGLARDHAAVEAAIATACSNAQAEGQITKLKLVARQMYGRGKLNLLEHAWSAPHDHVIKMATKPRLDAYQPRSASTLQADSQARRPLAAETHSRTSTLPFRLLGTGHLFRFQHTVSLAMSRLSAFG